MNAFGFLNQKLWLKNQRCLDNNRTAFPYILTLDAIAKELVAKLGDKENLKVV